ncbi:hypothetical protein BS50DRAFT_582272 [Corynespora cassiicola Philippines]|uniref:Ankyrin n=1 Tax=Corynespora cassiicola Philippines TaxID=1448308 RepID=A0A2T2PD71_CORCC|nr:hypothetical protein BS50DRAFT_582272 [Corynespora cassiicola Philippines]
MFLQDALISSLCQLFCSSLVSGSDSQVMYGFDGLKWLQTWISEAKAMFSHGSIILEFENTIRIPTLSALLAMQTAWTIYRYSFVGFYLFSKAPRHRHWTAILPSWEQKTMDQVKLVHADIKRNQTFQDRNRASPIAASLQHDRYFSEDIPIRSVNMSLTFEFGGGKNRENVATASAFICSTKISSKLESTLVSLRDMFQQAIRLQSRSPTNPKDCEDYMKGYDIVIDPSGKLRGEILALLYDAKINPKIFESARHMMKPAAAANWHEIVQSLLEMGVSPIYNKNDKSSVFDECLHFNSADSARVLIESGEFEGFDRDIILGTTRKESDRVLCILMSLGMCREYDNAPPFRDLQNEKPPLTTFGSDK